MSGSISNWNNCSANVSKLFDEMVSISKKHCINSMLTKLGYCRSWSRVRPAQLLYWNVCYQSIKDVENSYVW